MARLYVPLDVDFATDDKILAAGPLASYLYVCSLAFAKRTLSDGKITRTQLPVIAPGLTGKPTAHAQRLVDAGLWNTATDGWVITAWAKRNKLSEEITADNDAKRQRAIAANHQRWHVDTGRPSDTCALCYPADDPPRIRDGLRPGSIQDPKPMSKTKPEATTDDPAADDGTDRPLPRADQALHASAAKAALRLVASPDFDEPHDLADLA